MMPDWFDVAIRGSIVLFLGLVLCGLLRSRAAALRHAVLAAAFCAAPIVAPIGALLPAVTVAVPPFVRAGASVVPAPDPGSPALSTSDGPVRSGGTRRGASELSPALAPSTAPDAALVARVTWALGAIALLGQLLISSARFARAARRARPLTDARWLVALDAATTAAGMTRRIALRESPCGDVLAVFGWRRPCLLVPAEALRWPDDRIAIVLGHELAHIRRHDWAWQIYAAAVRAVFWWNPIAWLAHRQLTIEGERACDDAVLATGVAPHAYAEQLVAVARALHLSSSRPAAAVAMARPSTLHRRITAMLNPHLQRTIPGRVVTTLLICGLTALLVPVAVMRGAIAQAPLEGVVYDSSGAVVPDVELTLEANGQKAETSTDAEGRFAFPTVAPGTYVLEAKQRGFRELHQKLELEQPADWTRVITLQLGQVQETISVTGRRGSGVAPQPTGPVRVRVGGNIKPPRKLVDVKPIYPEAAQDAGREGDVTIDAVIGKDGLVTAARVTSPEVHPDLAAAAIDAVRQWKYSPTLLNGNPVEVVMSVSVAFKLE